MFEFSSATCPKPCLAPLFQDTCPAMEPPDAAAQSDLKTAEIAKELLSAVVLTGVFFFVIPPILSIGANFIEPALMALDIVRDDNRKN